MPSEQKAVLDNKNTFSLGISTITKILWIFEGTSRNKEGAPHVSRALMVDKWLFQTQVLCLSRYGTYMCFRKCLGLESWKRKQWYSCYIISCRTLNFVS